MSGGYTKLFSSIVTSTIWCEDYPTRLVWVAMLAMADARGKVDGSIPGFARIANVTCAEMEKAIATFLSPDPHSRTPDHDGRRIEIVPGGWLILNYAAYRESRDPDIRREQNRQAQARHRERESAMSAKVSHESAQAEAEAEAEAVQRTLSPKTGERVSPKDSVKDKNGRQEPLEAGVERPEPALPAAEVGGGRPGTPPKSTTAIPDPKVVMTFPLGKKDETGALEWNLTEAKMAEYADSYPTLDVLQALRSARQWLRDNPSQRKTSRGMPAFLSRWLTRDVDWGRSKKAAPPPVGSKSHDKYGDARSGR